MNETEAYQLWVDQFLAHDHMIKATAEQYPKVRSYDISINDITVDLSDLIQDDPETAIRTGEMALQKLMDPDNEVPLNLRISSHWPSSEVQLSEVSVLDIYKFVTVRGQIDKATEVRPRLVMGVFGNELEKYGGE